MVAQYTAVNIAIIFRWRFKTFLFHLS